MSSNPIDAQFNLRARHPNFQEYLDRNESLSATALASLPHQLDLPYGDHPLQTIDFFPASKPNAPIAIFIHGGYWRALDKRSYRFLAHALRGTGCATSLVNYRLMPEARMSDIVDDVLKAIELTARVARDNGANPQRLHLSGHSAGGHLALASAMRIQSQGNSLFPSIQSLFSLSGLFDLDPIRQSFLNEELNLSEQEVGEFSPLRDTGFHLPFPSVFAVGDGETDAFIDQSKAMSERILADGNDCVFELAPSLNHFDIVFDFGLQGGVLNGKLLDLVSQESD